MINIRFAKFTLEVCNARKMRIYFNIADILNIKRIAKYLRVPVKITLE